MMREGLCAVAHCVIVSTIHGTFGHRGDAWRFSRRPAGAAIPPPRAPGRGGDSRRRVRGDPTVQRDAVSRRLRGRLALAARPEPAIARLTGKLPDVSLFAPLAGNIHFLLISLTVAWTLAAFGEEFVYRGYLLTQIARVLGDTPRAWLAALVVTSIVFGVGHQYQGLSGMITAGLGGFVFGLLYLVTGRNLWVSVIAHGTMDTVGFLLLFLGKYPGV